jgi:hypothetical protein|tara:strand:- start:9286 stop:10257 length:972 start_codon:yes stop_codon:yes gene_type:complete
MANPSTREQLKDYALRSLGSPVIEINVADEQLEDRLDEAIEYFNINHWNGTERAYFQHVVTGTSINLTAAVAGNFTAGEVIEGGTSGCRASVHTSSAGSSIIYQKINNLTSSRTGFANGETITGESSGATGIINTVVKGDTENGYVPVGDEIFGVNKVFTVFSNTTDSRNIFDLQYQLRLNDLYDLTSTSIVYYTTVMGHLSLLDLMLNGKTLYRFNRMHNKLFLDLDWRGDVQIGDFIMADVYKALDPTTYTKVFGEPWLKKYTTALFKKQWGLNLKKFSGLVLPGGVSMDGDGIYNEAMNELQQLEDELIGKGAPLEFFTG